MPFKPEYYPANWKEISSRIKERDNHQCVRCGRSSGYYVKIDGLWFSLHDQCVGSMRDRYSRVFKMTLACIHINHNTEDNRDENLETACQWCHLEHDRPHHSRSIQYGLNHRIDQLSIFASND